MKRKVLKIGALFLATVFLISVLASCVKQGVEGEQSIQSEQCIQEDDGGKTEIISLIVSIIAAGAWIPIIIGFFSEKHRKICANVVDYRILTSAQASGSAKNGKINGTLLFLGVNFYVPIKSFFISEMRIKIKLNESAETECQLTDGILGETNPDGHSSYNLPLDYNLNLHREIINGRDNVRIIPIIAKDITFDDIEKIEYIKLTFIEKGLLTVKKEITIRNKDFPVFNRMNFISKFVERDT